MVHTHAIVRIRHNNVTSDVSIASYTECVTITSVPFLSFFLSTSPPPSISKQQYDTHALLLFHKI